MKKLSLALTLIGSVFFQTLFAEDKFVEPSLEYGAETYLYRCALCHGVYGYGDGLMAVSIKDYENTNLYKNLYGKDERSLRHSVVYGGAQGKMASEMPPWGDELTYNQIESLVIFLKKMIEEPEEVKRLVDESGSQKESVLMGNKLFKNYCTLCHGDEGKGDGKMMKLIKNPPPFNLTLSTVSPDYLKEIISKGGEKMGRSEHMPPWGEQFTNSEINSIIMYLETIRQPQN